MVNELCKNATETGGDKNVTIILINTERWMQASLPFGSKELLKIQKVFFFAS